MENLFLNTAPLFEKEAAETELSEDPTAWPQEILQELFKQVPYVADYDPQIVMDRVDGEKAYAFGHVQVSNKTEIPGTNPVGLQAAGVQQIRIPIVVNQGKMSPFDVIVTPDSKMLPLTEERLRRALFRPQAFDITAKTPGDQSMIGQLFPPYRQNYGLGAGGGVVSAGMGKSSAVNTSLLARVIAEGSEEDRQKVAAELEDPNVQAALLQNKFANEQSMRTIFSALTTPPPVKTASVDFGKALVTQLTQEEDGAYAIKTAYAKGLSRWVVDRGGAVRALGEKMVLAADIDGSAIVTDEELPPPVASTEADAPELIKDYGLYKVRTEDGKDLVGYVFPNLIDVDGTPLPIALFTNGSQAVVQGEIAGSRAGEGQSLPVGRPRGYGCFYRVLPNGKAEATIPLDIQASMSAQGAVSFSAQSYDGRPVQVVVQPNVASVQLSDDTMIVPDDFSWLPLNSADEVSLVSDPTMMHLEEETKSAASTVTIRCIGEDEIYLDGIPMAKVAGQRKSLSDTVFILAAGGVHPEETMQKAAHSLAFGTPAQVRLTRQSIFTAPLQQEKEAAKVDVSHLKKTLVKEAASIPDPTAVDTVLSIGFLQPENLHMFLEALPQLDKAQERLCELLVAARLGLREVSVQALENAVRSVEDVIQGLRVIAFEQN